MYINTYKVFMDEDQLNCFGNYRKERLFPFGLSWECSQEMQFLSLVLKDSKDLEMLRQEELKMVRDIQGEVKT